MSGLVKQRPDRPAPGAFEIARETTPVRIAAALRIEIAEGRLPPGTRIPELDFTAAFNVSRHTLREAISLLVSEGLLTRASFKGVEVTTLSVEDARDIYAARRMIELAAVDALASAASALWDELLGAIDALRTLRSPVDSPTMNRADMLVHLALVAAHRSKRIMSAYRALMTESQILLVRAYPPEDVASSIVSHMEFARMLRAGDLSSARAQLEARLRRSEQKLIERFGVSGAARRPPPTEN